ncbi:hypothetical protein Dsin_031441 [Dipteronia sinensis]|uniref:Pentatricopeptide repeat-containing protein n=1 Tax=Dipteronia sinensis TaxID=43782 RepID=A0AAD9ZMG2_9ROSI|nr:hypothetical protein Dsin_031441 [Dipteronia sinensis]
MKLFSTKFFPLLQQNRRNHSGVLLSSLFSNKTKTKTQIQTQIITQSSPSYSLYDRIQTIRDSKTSVVPVLDKWVGEGNIVDKRKLHNLVRVMKEFKRFHHALEISQWMTDRCLASSSSDVALRLDLIHRIHGIEHAEKYFNTISNDLKTPNVYGALLSLYAQETSVERAEAIMQKMREMGFATSSFPYNMLINLYIKTGDYDKIDRLMQEMGEKAIPLDKYTVRNRIAAYIAASDLSGMERVLNRVEENHNFVVDWDLYSLAASGYVKLGLIEKALVMIEKMERLIPPRKNKLAFEFLLTLYASTGMKNELYRVWNKYKPSNNEMNASHNEMNASHACMITCLAKLDDIEGAEKIFEEWESKCTMYDFRVLNRLLVAYCRKGLIEKAESALNKAVEGRKPYASSWNVLATGYVEQSQMLKAVEMLKRAISVGRGRWSPTSVTLDPCLDFLEGKGDVGGIEDIIKSLKKPLTRDIYHRWLRTCVAAGDSVSEVLDQMELDGFSVDEETDKILKTGQSVEGAI